MWLPDRHTDRRRKKLSLCAAMLRRRHKRCERHKHREEIGEQTKYSALSIPPLGFKFTEYIKLNVINLYFHCVAQLKSCKIVNELNLIFFCWIYFFYYGKISIFTRGQVILMYNPRTRGCNSDRHCHCCSCQRPGGTWQNTIPVHTIFWLCKHLRTSFHSLQRGPKVRLLKWFKIRP